MADVLWVTSLIDYPADDYNDRSWVDSRGVLTGWMLPSRFKPVEVTYRPDPEVRTLYHVLKGQRCWDLVDLDAAGMLEGGDDGKWRLWLVD